MLKKLIPLMVFVTLVSVFALSTISADVAAGNVPVSGANYSSAISFMVTYANDSSDVQDPTAADSALNYSTDDGASWTSIDLDASSISAYAANTSTVSFTLAIDAISDTTDVDFNVTLGNSSAPTQNTSSTGWVGITIDDTAPTLRLSPSDSVSYGSLIKYDCGDNLDTTPAITVTHPSGDSTATTSIEDEGSALKSFSDTDYEGDFTFACSDYTGNAATSDSVSVGALGGSQLGRTAQAISSDTSNNNQNLIILVVIVVVIAYLARKK